MKKVIGGGVMVAVMVLTQGCVVRTYQLTRDRVDQDLSTGNRGYISGQAAPYDKERRATRDTQVVEVELRSPFKSAQKCPPVPQATTQPLDVETAQEGNRGYISENIPEETMEAEPVAAEKYTVVKGDTLQKISQKLYGTTKKWHKIFKMNQDVLKSANSIYPGQVINVPAQADAGTRENLK